MTALFGRSGSGKTSVVRMIAGLMRPDAGRISLDGSPLVDASANIFVPRHRIKVLPITTGDMPSILANFETFGPNSFTLRVVSGPNSIPVNIEELRTREFMIEVSKFLK